MSDHQGHPLPPLPHDSETPVLTIHWQDYVDRINLAQAEEREACAAILESWLDLFGAYTPGVPADAWARSAMQEAMRKIRARG